MPIYKFQCYAVLNLIEFVQRQGKVHLITCEFPIYFCSIISFETITDTTTITY